MEGTRTDDIALLDNPLPDGISQEEYDALLIAPVELRDPKDYSGTVFSSDEVALLKEIKAKVYHPNRQLTVPDLSKISDEQIAAIFPGVDVQEVKRNMQGVLGYTELLAWEDMYGSNGGSISEDIIKDFKEKGLEGIGRRGFRQLLIATNDPKLRTFQDLKLKNKFAINTMTSAFSCLQNFAFDCIEAGKTEVGQDILQSIPHFVNITREKNYNQLPYPEKVRRVRYLDKKLVELLNNGLGIHQQLPDQQIPTVTKMVI
jgi:hypothetical protein